MDISYRSVALSTFLLILCCLNSPSLGHTDPFLQCLSRNNQSADIIHTPKSADYTTILQDRILNSRFNTSDTPKPTVIVTPWLDSQVQTIVTCAKKAGTLLKIRSGGHDFEGLSYTSKTPFAILDMFRFNHSEINLKDKTAWIQAGSTIGELYYRIWEKSKVLGFPGGVCPTIGLGGYISGGGYGNMLRKYGLSVDNLVDAKGTILDRDGMGEDVFWAIRGGGGASFGVILAYKIKLVRVPRNVTVFQVPKTLEENATDLVDRWQYVASKVDKNLFLRVFLHPTKLNGTKTVRATFVALFLGDANKLASIIKSKFPELGVKKEDYKEMSWIKSILYWAGFPNETPETALLSKISNLPLALKMKSDYVKAPIPKDGLKEALKKMANSRGVRMILNPYGGKMSEIPESATAFPHRDGNIYKIEYLSGSGEVKSAIQEIRDFFNFMTPFVSKNPREAFLNYRDLDVGSTDNGQNRLNEARVYGVKYFKGNFDRLPRVKTKFDPENFFRNEQSIPPLKIHSLEIKFWAPGFYGS